MIQRITSVAVAQPFQEFNIYKKHKKQPRLSLFKRGFFLVLSCSL